MKTLMLIAANTSFDAFTLITFFLTNLMFELFIRIKLVVSLLIESTKLSKTVSQLLIESTLVKSGSLELANALKSKNA